MVQKPKILFISHSVGGVDVWLRLILANLNPNLFDIVVVHGFSDTKKTFLNKENNPLKEYITAIDRDIHPGRDSKAIFQTTAIVRKEKPNLIHAHSAKAGIIGRLVGAATKTPVFYTPHAFSYLSTSSKLKRNFFLNLERFFSKFNNKILATSESEKLRAIKDVGYSPENVIVFNNCINEINKTKKLSIPQTWPDSYICSVGRPSYQKNIELMVEVIKEVSHTIPKIHLVLMGVGFHSPNLKNVKAKISAYGLEKNITLLEWTERDDVLHIISKSELYISTARYEGLPYSVIEALALKKACVVSDADGNRDLIVDSKNGFVIKNERSKDFSNAILKLLENDKMRGQFEENSFRIFSEHFNIKNTIHKLENIYTTEVNEKEE